MEATIAANSLLLPRSFPRPEAPKSLIPSPLFSPRPSSPRDFGFPSHIPKSARIPPPRCASPGLQDSKSAPGLAVLLEVEGVVADIYRSCNRQAFNVAFQNLGLDCANWTQPIYSDLTRKASSDEERMLILFFNRIGWPTSLPTNEKDTFLKGLLREKLTKREFSSIKTLVGKYFPVFFLLVEYFCQQKALEDIVTSSNLPLRPGVENFIDDALNEGVPVVMLTAYSKNGDKMSRSIVEKLGDDRISKIKIVGKEEVEGSFYGQLVLGKGISSSLDEQLVKETQKAVSMEKQRIAEEVASILKLSVDIDTSPSESLKNVVATLRAGAEYAGLPVQNCVLIAGTQSGVLGAERIGMPCVVLRSSATARAEFRWAKAVMDGFGGADLTISRLRSKIWS